MNKIKKIFENIESKNLDHLLIVSEINIFWAVNFWCSYGFLLFSKNKKEVNLFLDPRYISEAQNKIKNINIIPLNKFKTKWNKINGRMGIDNEIKLDLFNLIKKDKKEILSINFDSLRMIKTHEEIEKIEKISKITDKIWKKIIKLNLKNFTEKEIDIKIRQLFLKNRINNISFDPIVSTGLNSVNIHTKPTNTKIKEHLLCDFGGKSNGYCSDYTRTIILNKNKKLIKYYDFVKKVSEKCFEFIKPGVLISDLVKISNKLYKENNYKVHHSLGHGIGLKVHEYPFLTENTDLKLEEGMVFTIEPGIYVKGVGGVRYENIVVVTKNGYKLLTS